MRKDKQVARSTKFYILRYLLFRRISQRIKGDLKFHATAVVRQFFSISSAEVKLDGFTYSSLMLIKLRTFIFYLFALHQDKFHSIARRCRRRT